MGGGFMKSFVVTALALALASPALGQDADRLEKARAAARAQAELRANAKLPAKATRNTSAKQQMQSRRVVNQPAVQPSTPAAAQRSSKQTSSRLTEKNQRNRGSTREHTSPMRTEGDDRRTQQKRELAAMLGLLILGAAMNSAGGNAYPAQATDRNAEFAQHQRQQEQYWRDRADREGANPAKYGYQPRSLEESDRPR